MIREDKTPTKKILSTKNNIYIGLCILYIVINDKQEISNRRCNAEYRLSFNMVFSFIVGSCRCTYK